MSEEADRRGESSLPGSVQGLVLTCPPTGLYGTEGILPARRTLRPQGKTRWQQLWEVPTLLWEAPRLGLDTAQGLELLSLLGSLLALGALLLRRLCHPLTYLLLWAAYLSACQASGAASCPPHHWEPCHQPPQPHPPPTLPASLPCLLPQPYSPCSLTALLLAGGPGVSVFPVVSDYRVWACRRLGWGRVCLPVPGGPCDGSTLMGGSLCSSYSP